MQLNSIAIVTNEALLAESLSHSLADLVSARVTHCRADFEQTLDELRTNLPTVTLIDTDASGYSPYKIAEGVRRHALDTKLVFIARKESDLLLQQVDHLRADGLILKSDALAQFTECLNKVKAGDNWMSPAIRPLSDEAGHDSKDDDEIRASVSSLTSRQLEVLCYIAQGYTVKEVAKLMYLSEKSVDSHKYRIMNRLGIHDRVKLALFAIRENLIDP